MNDESNYENDTPPEKIWLQFYNDEAMFECEDEPELNTGLLASHPEERYWHSTQVFEHDIAYIQTAVHDAEIARLREQIDVQDAEIERLRQIWLASGTDDNEQLHAIDRLIAELQEVEARAKRHDDMTKAKPADVVADLKAQIAQMQEVAK